VLKFQVALALTVVVAIAAKPRSNMATWYALASVPLALLLGRASPATLRSSLATTVPLLLFLTSAFSLARLAADAGLADRLASLLKRAAKGRPLAAFALTCVVCAGLTATVSLDGAVVLMVPVVLALARNEQRLLQPLLLATVGTANAFSLAVPQGNPTNLVVMERLHIGPGAFLEHLLVPGLLATVVCAVTIAFAQRRSLTGKLAAPGSDESSPLTTAGRRALVILAAAALAGAVAPWLGIAPWWGLCAVAAVAFVERCRAGRPPRVEIPWRIAAQVAALLVVFGPLAGSLTAPARAASPATLVAVSLAVAAIACVVNNLPGSVLVAGTIGAPGLTAYASLTGLSVGALATPHGSVATLIALQRTDGEAIPASGHVRVLLPAAALATAVAAASIWAIPAHGAL
jgi:Na+/H+ antiporter NhaD/arsenite permease-like protein